MTAQGTPAGPPSQTHSNLLSPYGASGGHLEAPLSRPTFQNRTPGCRVTTGWTQATTEPCSLRQHVLPAAGEAGSRGRVWPALNSGAQEDSGAGEAVERSRGRRRPAWREVCKPREPGWWTAWAADVNAGLRRILPVLPDPPGHQKLLEASGRPLGPCSPPACPVGAPHVRLWTQRSQCVFWASGPLPVGGGWLEGLCSYNYEVTHRLSLSHVSAGQRTHMATLTGMTGTHDVTQQVLVT